MKIKKTDAAMLREHEFAIREEGTKAVFVGAFIQIEVAPVEEGYSAKVSSKKNQLSAEAQNEDMASAIVDAVASFESVASSDQDAVDEATSVADEFESDSVDYDSFEEELEDDDDEDEEDL